MCEKMIEIHNLGKKAFIGKPNELQILRDISLTINKGEFVAIVGASGSGKTTLMNIIGALDRPTCGEYLLESEPVHNKTDPELSDIRNQKVGFVFQTFNLIPRNSALKNVELPMLYAGSSRSQRRQKAKELLHSVGMAERIHHLPNELSGGEKQRVAIARALANDPAIILADEPTGALDSSTGRVVMDIFHKVHATRGATVILVTHNYELAEETERIITLKDGCIVDEIINHKHKVFDMNRGEPHAFS